MPYPRKSTNQQNLFLLWFRQGCQKDQKINVDLSRTKGIKTGINGSVFQMAQHASKIVMLFIIIASVNQIQAVHCCKHVFYSTWPSCQCSVVRYQWKMGVNIPRWNR